MSVTFAVCGARRFRPTTIGQLGGQQKLSAGVEHVGVVLVVDRLQRDDHHRRIERFGGRRQVCAPTSVVALSVSNQLQAMGPSGNGVWVRVRSRRP